MAEKKTNAMRIVEKNKINYEMFTYEVSEEHLDAVSVANSIAQNIRYVYKTLVLQGADKNYYVCVINGADELDLKKTARAFNVKNISMIPVSEINKITGYIRGGCSPIGMKKQLTTIIDESARQLDNIIISGGQRGMQIKIAVDDLQKIINAKFDNVIKGE